MYCYLIETVWSVREKVLKKRITKLYFFANAFASGFSQRQEAASASNIAMLF